MTPADDEFLPAVTIEPSAAANAAVIWLHGLGADGHDFEPIVPWLKLPPSAAVRFVFPHAPHRPVTLNQGMIMRAWYDIDPHRRQEDETGIRASESRLRRLIEREIELGIDPARIVLAGFSQGGALVLHTGLRYPVRLGGIAVLSAYLLLASTLSREAGAANRDVPILMAHGSSDTVIPIDLARHSCEYLRGQGYGVEWSDYDIGHSVCPAEIDVLSGWLGRLLAGD